MLDKELYIKIYNEKRSIKLPIFSTPWWLDAVCGSENWDAIVLDDGMGGVKAMFPITYEDRKHKRIGLPLLTQKLGTYIVYPKGQSNFKKLAYDNEIVDKIVEQLPKINKFNINFNYTFTNWLPFYWKGFKQTTRYTYIVQNLNQNVFAKFAPCKRTDIRKAEKLVDVMYDLSGEEFIRYYSESLCKQGKNLIYSQDRFLKLYNAVLAHDSGRIIYAIKKDNPRIITGAIFYVWDSYSIYNLVTAFDPDYRNTGSSSLLFYQIMKDFSDSGLKFDFEGSMVETIEHSYNKFGTVQVPYYTIYGVFNYWTELKEAFRNIVILKIRPYLWNYLFFRKLWKFKKHFGVKK